MKYPVLMAGDRNLAVRAMQNALHRALHKKGLPHKNARNGAYGANTIKDVVAFEIAYGVRPVSGRVFGPKGWAKLKPFMGRIDRGYVTTFNAQVRAREAARAAAAAMKNEDRVRERIVAAAFKALYDGRYVYRQYRPMASVLDSLEARGKTDCSSFVTLCYKAGGAPDPNGFGYNGYGFTGTMDARTIRGTWVSQPKAGDLAFYGRTRWATSHVALHISPSEVISFGSTPIRRLPVRYRQDYLGSKRFPLT